ncbi:hypothetical protein SAMN05216417_12024 [Nitrosospira multiformis]|uniref:Uncharacterized protein n=1 Tax=Nitrosospira multiformis TaxID=1231 RepID=A0A1I7IIG1_9PROT|nr:hypothetical protein SAMN05216417_12024 [Nitrosospira multiformis]
MRNAQINGVNSAVYSALPYSLSKNRNLEQRRYFDAAAEKKPDRYSERRLRASESEQAEISFLLQRKRCTVAPDEEAADEKAVNRCEG